MRKSLSLLLAVALVFAMFAPLALADDATLTTEQKFEDLKEAGIFSGVLKADGSTDAALDENMTRAQFGIVIANLLGLSDGNPTTATFKDLPSSHWAHGAVEAAVKAGILKGRGNGIYDPKSDVSVQELAIVLVTALGLSVDDSVTSVPGAAYWAAKYVQAAVAAGLIPAQASYTNAATRAQLVDASYVAAEAIAQSSVTTTEVKVISSKEISVTFSDGVTKSFAVDPALVSGVATKVTFEYNGKTYTETVTLKELAVSAKVVGAKKVDLVFNQAIDTSKATIAVKNNNNTVNIKTTTFSDDKTTAKLEFANNLAKADYTVTVSGLTEKALTATFSIEDEKVVKIEFTSDKAVLDRADATNHTVTVGYKVFNQYNEEITGSTALTPTSGKAGTTTASDGTLKIVANSEFILNEIVAVSLIHPASSVFASTTLTVSPAARVATVDIKSLHHDDDKTLQVGGEASNTFSLLLDLKDQYGSTITDTTNVADDVIVTVSNPTVVTVNGYSNGNATFGDKTIDGTKHLVLRLAGTQTAGKSNITIISKTTGNKDSFEVEVKDSVKIDTLTLSSPDIAVAGEKVNIPYTAVDQFGATIDHPTNGQLASISSTRGTINFVKDIAKNKTNLVLDLAGIAEQTVIISAVTGTNKVVQLSVTVKEAAVPTVITGTKDFDTAILKDGTVTIGNDNVVVQDQYGRDITPTWGTAAAQYRVLVETSDNTKVSTSPSGNNAIINNSANVVLTGVAKGSSTITLKLQKGDATNVANSSYTYTQKVVEKGDIASYEASVTDTVYSGGTGDYFKDLKVTGLLADGSKVTIPNNRDNYNVTVNTAGVSHNNATGKIEANLYNGYATDKDTADVSAVVTVKAADGAKVIVVTVKVSKAAPEATKLSLKDKNGTVETVDGVVYVNKGTNLSTEASRASLVNGIVKTEDQYGVEIPTAFTNANVIISNESDGLTLGNLKAEDSFNVTAITNNNKVINFKVVAR